MEDDLSLLRFGIILCLLLLLEVPGFGGNLGGLLLDLSALLSKDGDLLWLPFLEYTPSFTLPLLLLLALDEPGVEVADAAPFCDAGELSLLVGADLEALKDDFLLVLDGYLPCLCSSFLVAS